MAASKQAFVRPAGNALQRFIIRLLPPAPVDQVKIDYMDLKSMARKRHYWIAAIPLAVVIGITLGAIWIAPWMRYSILSGAIMGINSLPLSVYVALFLIWMLLAGVCVAFVYAFPRRQGVLNSAALFEEQMYREGAEDWSFWDKVRSCLVFGPIHFLNLIYPIAIALAMVGLGVCLMWLYLYYRRHADTRQEAVLQTAVIHRVFNTMGLWVSGLFFAVAFPYTLYQGLYG